MIFFITGRVGTGVDSFVEKMRAAGYHDVVDELRQMDGHSVTSFDDNLPCYAHVQPNQIYEMLKTFPNELFHIIYIQPDEDNDKTRKDWYVSDGNDEAKFDSLNTAETAMFDKLENLLNMQDDIDINLRATHRITNNHDGTTQNQWVDYFIAFHRMYIRLVKLTKLGVKIGALRTSEDGNIIVYYKGKNGNPPRKESVTPELFGQILLTDDIGVAVLTRNVLELASTEDLASILN